MPKNIEVWTIGRMAAQHGIPVADAVERYAEVRQSTRGQDEIFRDGYANLNRDYAVSLDRAGVYA